MIKKTPNKNEWTVMSETTGKSFGTFKTSNEAKKRLRQIEYFKSVNKSK